MCTFCAGVCVTITCVDICLLAPYGICIAGDVVSAIEECQIFASANSFIVISTLEHGELSGVRGPVINANGAMLVPLTPLGVVYANCVEVCSRFGGGFGESALKWGVDVGSDASRVVAANRLASNPVRGVDALGIAVSTLDSQETRFATQGCESVPCSDV